MSQEEEPAAVVVQKEDEFLDNAPLVRMRPIQVMTETVSGNGGRIFRFTAIIGMLCNLVLMFDAGYMANLRGTEGSNLASNYSPTLVTLASLSCICTLISVWDFKKIWSDTKDTTHPFIWEWQHENFKRAIVPFAFHSLVIWPTMLTFILHSRGQAFFKLVSSASNSLYTTYVMIIVSFIFLLLSGMINFGTVKNILNTGDFGNAEVSEENREAITAIRKSRVTVWEFFGKLSALAAVASSITFTVGIFRACSLGVNSALYTVAIIFVLIASLNFFFNMNLVLRIKNKSKKWWLAYRAITAVTLFLAYISFWVVLLLVALLSTGTKQGYFYAIANLATGRRDLVYANMITYAVYLLIIILRVYYAKLRKEGRQERILEAQFVNPALERLLNLNDKKSVDEKSIANNENEIADIEEAKIKAIVGDETMEMKQIV